MLSVNFPSVIDDDMSIYFCNVIDARIIKGPRSSV